MKTFIVLCLTVVTLVAGASLDKASTKETQDRKLDEPSKNHAKRGLIDYGYGYAKEPELHGGFKPSFGYDISVSQHHVPQFKTYAAPDYHHNQYAPLYKEPTVYNWKEEKHTIITKKVPVPYPVNVEKQVVIEKQVPVHVPVRVHVPYRVEVEKKVPVYVEKKVHVDRPVPYPVKVKVPVYHKVEVEVPKPYPVHIPKPYPVYIEKEVHVPVVHRVEVEKPYPVYVEKPVLVEQVESHEQQQHQEQQQHEYSHEHEHSHEQVSHELHSHEQVELQGHELQSHEQSHEQEHEHIVHHDIRPVGIKSTNFISEPIHVPEHHEHQYGEESQKIERKVESDQKPAATAASEQSKEVEKPADKESSQ
uniref:Cuticular protein (putative) n=1 Tax=Anopheles christyi TaxID=43041 RepID=A0A182K927_9DIPT